MPKREKNSIRDFGIQPGFMKPGKRNSITDVPGVQVGNWTLNNEKHHTGVTVILPRKHVYDHKCTAAAWVLNGYGKSAGLVQVEELGQLETPIALTNTLNVGLVMDALVQYTIEDRAALGETVRSINAVVGECNDSRLNTITERVVGYEEVMAAIRDAGEDCPNGCVGAGAGMTCHGLKGGIGTASRIVRTPEGTFTVGVLGLCNHGELKELTLGGIHAGGRIGKRIAELTCREATGASKTAGQTQQEGEAADAGNRAKERGEAAADEINRSGDRDEGSCILVLACDAPLSSRQLKRVIKRCAVGMARCGSYWGHGSGDILLGFTTARDIPDMPKGLIDTQRIWNENQLDLLFAAAAEASEEAVLNALAGAVTTTGPDGTVRWALRDVWD